MSNILNAEIRKDVGKGASRRLRREGKVPAIIYGTDKAPQMLTLSHNQLSKAISNEEFFSQIITIDTDVEKEQVVLKDLQRHVYKSQILHVDFLRIKADEKLDMYIPLHFIGEASAPGLKQGGIFSRTVSEVEIRCLPADLPKYIAVDVSNLGLNETIHLSDLVLPTGVEILALAQGPEHDQPVITLHLAKMEEIVEQAAPVSAEVPTTAETEPKEEEEEEKGKSSK